MFFDIESTDIAPSRYDNAQQSIINMIYWHLKNVNHNTVKVHVASACSNTKFSLHIVCDIIVDLYYNKHVAENINRFSKQNICDTAVYRKNGFMRLPQCVKIVDKQIINRQFRIVTPSVFSNFIIGLIDEDMPKIRQPLALLNDCPVDIINHNEKFEDEHKQKLQEYLNNNGIKQFLLKDTNVSICEIIIDQSYTCMICERKHNSDNLYCIKTSKSLKLRCRRNDQDGDKMHMDICQIEQTPDDDLLTVMKKYVSAYKNDNEIEVSVINKPYVSFDLQADITCVKSGLGTGKTYQAQKIIEQYDESDSIIIMSHRITFAQSVAERLGFKCYLDIEDSMINNKKYPRIIIQTESLKRITLHKKISLLIIDEIESQLDQMQSKFIHNKNESLTKFDAIVNASDKILCMDGFMNKSTINVLKYMAPDKSIQMITNLYKPYKSNNVNIVPYTHSMTMRNSICQHLQHLIIDQGKKVVIMCTSNGQVAEICKYMLQPNNIQYKCYTGDDMKVTDGTTHYNQKIADFKDVNSAWCDIQCLIYTSTLTAGVDFNLDCFDTFVHIYRKNTCTVNQFVQGMFRVRKYIDKKHTIYFEREYEYKNTNPNAVLKEMAMSGEMQTVINKQANKQEFDLSDAILNFQI